MTDPKQDDVLADVEPANDELIDSMLRALRDMRNHEHPFPDVDNHCVSLIEWLGGHAEQVLRRLADEQAANRALEGKLTAQEQVFRAELDQLRAQLGGVGDKPRGGIPAVRIVDAAAECRGLYGVDKTDLTGREIPEHDYRFEVTRADGGSTCYHGGASLTADDIVNDRRWELP